MQAELGSSMIIHGLLSRGVTSKLSKTSKRSPNDAESRKGRLSCLCPVYLTWPLETKEQPCQRSGSSSRAGVGYDPLHAAIVRKKRLRARGIFGPSWHRERPVFH